MAEANAIIGKFGTSRKPMVSGGSQGAPNMKARWSWRSLDTGYREGLQFPRESAACRRSGDSMHGENAPLRVANRADHTGPWPCNRNALRAPPCVDRDGRAADRARQESPSSGP